MQLVFLLFKKKTHSSNSDQSTLRQSIRSIIDSSPYPVFCFPEGALTDGKHLLAYEWMTWIWNSLSLLKDITNFCFQSESQYNLLQPQHGGLSQLTLTHWLLQHGTTFFGCLQCHSTFGQFEFYQQCPSRKEKMNLLFATESKKKLQVNLELLPPHSSKKKRHKLNWMIYLTIWHSKCLSKKCRIPFPAKLVMALQWSEF